MSVHITIHRGTEQIGGSVTEISMGKTNILVDFGSSLPGSQGAVSDDELVKKVFHRKEHHIDAVFFTHYHGDHTGLMDKIPADIPIYIHSTGHADKATLAKFIQDIAPRKYIVPFHTEDAEGFKSLDIEEKYKDMIILPNDGDMIEIA